MNEICNISDIMKILPHRYPFILIDRIISYIPEQKVIALKNVTINEPFFAGHFPEAPVMPGVLIIEAMTQASSIFAYAERLRNNEESKILYLSGIDKVKFRKPVIPGDQLILELTVLKRRKNVFKVAGRATVDNQLAAEGQIMGIFGEEP